MLLISTKAGSVGINLVAAQHLVLYDVDWNPVHNAQAVYRIFRLGQAHPTFVYRLMYAGTMEEKMYERNLGKEQLFK